MKTHVPCVRNPWVRTAVVSALLLTASLAAAPAESLGGTASTGKSSGVRVGSTTTHQSTAHQTTAHPTVQAQALVAHAPDPDRYATNLTAWWWYTNATPADLQGKVREGYRIVDLELRTAAPTFSAALVHNSGTYARNWWWYFGLTAAQVGEKVEDNGARVIDLERYSVGGKTRYAVVMVENAGVAQKTWWYYINVSTDFVAKKLKKNKARPIDLDTQKSNGTFRHDVVMIKNAGVDALKWWWYVNVTPDFIADKINKNKARLIDIERDGNRFDVVMERNKGQYWWWYFGKKAAQIQEAANQNGARIYRVEPYVTNGKTRYAAVMINNVDKETTRLRNIMAKGVGKGRYGFYVKRVDQLPSTALQSEAIFEPASAIKVLYHLAEMRRVMQGVDSPSDLDFVWYHYPGQDNSGACPSPGDETLANREVSTVQFGLNTMMQNSDNRTTRGFQLRLGNAAVNLLADAAGMENTELRQILGCGFRNFLRNDLTLEDAGELYEGVIEGTLLNDTNDARSIFWDTMNGGIVADDSRIAQVVKDEAAKLGLTSIDTTRFLRGVSLWSKGGSYDVCLPLVKCSPPYEYIRTVAGRATLPYRTAAGITSVNFVWGRFVEKLSLDCPFKKKSQTAAQYGNICPAWEKANSTLPTIDAEIFRADIRKALSTWV